MSKRFVIPILLIFTLGQFGCGKQNEQSAQAVASNDAPAAAMRPCACERRAVRDANAPSPSSSQPPQDAPGYVALGIELYKQNRDGEAAEAFKQATTLDPKLAEAYLRLGLTYRALDQREEAEKAYEQAAKAYEKLLDREPKNAEAHLSLGEAYSKIGEYQKAIEAYRRGVRLKEPDAGVYYDIGLTYNKLARYGEAVTAFKKALEFDPDDYRAQEALERAQADDRRQKARIEEEKRKLQQTVKASVKSKTANSANNKNLPPANSNF
jgi:tetratricopeptide (TPR) repeat protein